MATKRAWIYPDPESNDHCYIGFTFNSSFIEALKRTIPYCDRAYLPDKKLWWFDDIYLEDVTRLAKIFFDQVDVREAPPAEPAYPATPHAVLYLLPTAPEPVVRAAYKALAKMYHPDAGGDHQKMLQLNLAYEAIEGGSYGH